MEDIREQIENTLLRRDGKLNSPAIHSNKNKDLIEMATTLTESILPENSTFARIWWHIKNNLAQIPGCAGCNNVVKWNDHSKTYTRFCSQKCAVTSTEASIRTSKQRKGKKLSPEHCDKIRKRMVGHHHSDATKQKLSEQKKGSNNPSYGKTPWNKGLTGKLSHNYGKKRPGTGLRGKDNPQYGKSPSPKAGRGIWGNFNGFHFRSSLELMYLIYWKENNIEIKTGESKEFRVEYITEKGTTKTYSPDFYLEHTNTLIEIKPENLHDNKIVLLKFESLKNHHTDKICKIIGFREIGNFIKSVITNSVVDDYIDDKILIINTIQYARLRKNYADIIRAVDKSL